MQTRNQLTTAGHPCDSPNIRHGRLNKTALVHLRRSKKEQNGIKTKYIALLFGAFLSFCQQQQPKPLFGCDALAVAATGRLSRYCARHHGQQNFPSESTRPQRWWREVTLPTRPEYSQFRSVDTIPVTILSQSSYASPSISSSHSFFPPKKRSGKDSKKNVSATDSSSIESSDTTFDTELQRRIDEGANYENFINEHEMPTKAFHIDPMEIPQRAGIFCGYRVTKEEKERLRSADPNDYK